MTSIVPGAPCPFTHCAYLIATTVHWPTRRGAETLTSHQCDPAAHGSLPAIMLHASSFDTLGPGESAEETALETKLAADIVLAPPKLTRDDVRTSPPFFEDFKKMPERLRTAPPTAPPIAPLGAPLAGGLSSPALQLRGGAATAAALVRGTPALVLLRLSLALTALPGFGAAAAAEAGAPLVAAASGAPVVPACEGVGVYEYV